MRPKSILYFERLFYLGLALLLVQAYLAAGEAEPSAENALLATVLRVLALAFTFAVNGLMLWFIAYRASNVVKWIFMLLCALGLLIFLIGWYAHPSALRASGDFTLGLEISLYLLEAIEIWLLFRPDARDWFAGRRPVDPEIFS